MKIGKFLKPFLKQAEGLLLEAARDRLAKGAPVNVGYGHVTNKLKPGQSITEEQADKLLDSDLATTEQLVRRAIGDAPTLQREFDAMVSLAFNIGPSAFTRSTLLAKHVKGDKEGAADEFLRWKFSGGKAREGLLERRQTERDIYLGKTKLASEAPSPTVSEDHSSEQ